MGSCKNNFDFKDSKKVLPEGFLLGVSTASYQIEGAWNEDGKGESIWDRLTHTIPNAVINGDNGDIACNSYHKYKEDIKLMKDIGFEVYRFSISWSRILPNGGIDYINQAGVDYYHKVINELIENGIEPMVTIYHWDLPQKLQDIGGWLNPRLADYFEDYAKLVFTLYGNKVKWWNTINEPLEIVHGYTAKRYAPYLDMDTFSADYLAGHTLLLAHAKAYRLYDREFRSKQNGKVCITLSGFYYHPKSDSESDIQAADRAMQFEIGWFAHPIYSKKGDYPEIMRKMVDQKSKEEGRARSRLPYFTEEEINLIEGSHDFFSINHYTTRLCTSGTDPDYCTRYKDGNFLIHTEDHWPTSHIFWLKVVPWGFREQLRWIKDQYDNPPVYITENGYCDSGEKDDIARINYYKEYLSEMLIAIYDYGCNVIGHNSWSLLDNFEWLFGYSFRFGMVHVDFEDPERKRTPKLSTDFMHELIKTRIIPNKNYGNDNIIREEITSS